MDNNKQSKNIDHFTLPTSASRHLSCGYIIYDIDNVIIKWKCIYCFLIMKEPIQLTECGHRCCRGCFESRAAEAIKNMMFCPVPECNTAFDTGQVMPDRAFKKELDGLVITCCYKKETNCNWIGKLNAYQEHLDKDHIHHVCSDCGSPFSSSQLLANHQATNCQARFMKCELGSVCGEQLIPNDQYDVHLLTLQHQEAIALILSGKCDIRETSDQDQTMELTTPDDGLEQQTSEKLADLADKVQKLNNDTVELSRDFLKLNELCQVATQEVNNFQVAMNARNMVMSNLQPKQDSIQKDIDQLKQNLEDSQHVSTDATLTWRVDRVAERMADAQSDRVPSIYSPIFYSSPNGYKMRARLYLHGDGNARRTHMSLFFSLMKGEYDALLNWPFGFKVTFCLFDQTGNNRHIIDSFRPDTKSNSFQRPKTETNIASGIPKFFPLPMIQQDDNPYVRDDTLFLKIIIDLTDTPKMILPYMLTLNPGLPNHVQQILITQEKIKRQQQQNNPSATTSQSDARNPVKKYQIRLSSDFSSQQSNYNLII